MRPQVLLRVLGFFVLGICSTVPALASDVIPAGTVLNVRTTAPISATSAYPGAQYDVILDEPVVVDGLVVIPRDAVATLEVIDVERSSNLKGKERISVRLNSVHAGNRSYRVSTSVVEFKGRSEGKNTAKKIIGGAGIGTALGGIFGGGSGAALGAVTGGGTGAIIAGSDKQHLVVPAETRLGFRLSSSVVEEP